jgi:hypothetical protein
MAIRTHPRMRRTCTCTSILFSDTLNTTNELPIQDQKQLYLLCDLLGDGITIDDGHMLVDL